MKIKRESSKFKPITLTIETEQEAIALWHRLNASKENVEKSADLEWDDGCVTDMWSMLDDLFTPPKES